MCTLSDRVFTASKSIILCIFSQLGGHMVANNWQGIFDNRKRLFWILHTFGWLGFALVEYIASVVHEMRGIYVFVIALNAYAGWLLTLSLRVTYRRFWNAPPWKLVVIVLLTSYVVAMCWTVIKNFNFWEIYRHGYRPDDWVNYFRYSIMSFSITLCWSGLYFGVKYYRMLQRERERLLKANTMAHEVQLKMLRYQLNPHFLFNTLNAISTLILINDNKTANGMVTRLSEFLRYSLHTDPINMVPLEQEVYALKLYLDIEKVRFEERLTVDFDIQDDARDALVPSMLLQPLIENSIKHAIALSEEGGSIKVKANVFGHDLLIEVSDDGPGAPIKDGKLAAARGVGIANTEDRLKTLYNNAFAFALSHADPHGLKINIRIPLQFNEDSSE